MDLLIRTSGEHRLSDFMLWQSHFALLVFSDTLWPDYSFWDLLQALVHFQRSHPQLQELAVLRCQQTGPSVGALPKGSLGCVQNVEAECGIGFGRECCQASEQSQDETGVVMTDVDTSDSSVSSDSRPTSRSSSPAHCDVKLHVQQQLQVAQQEFNQPERGQSSRQCCDDEHQQPVAGTEGSQQLHSTGFEQEQAAESLTGVLQRKCSTEQEGLHTHEQQHADFHPDRLFGALNQASNQMHTGLNCRGSVSLSKRRGRLN